MANQKAPDTKEPELPTDQIPNEDIRFDARQFRDAVKFLFENNLTEPPKINCLSVLLSLGGFAIELYLKSLCAKLIHTHDDPDDPLTPSRVTAISQKCHRLVALLEKISPVHRGPLEMAYESKPVVTGKPTLKDALADYDDIFARARYPFETANVSANPCVFGLMNLLDFIFAHVESLKPQTTCK